MPFSWTFEPVVHLWGLLVVIGAGVLMAWFQYQVRAVYGTTARYRWILFSLRVALFLLLALLLAGPQVKREKVKKRPPRMLVMFDTSESMNSAENQESPTAFVNLRDNFFRFLYPLWQDQFQFRFYSFSSHLFSTDPETLQSEDSVGGAATNIRGAIQDGLSQQGNNRPAAVLLLTDGNHNWGPKPTIDILYPEEEGNPVPLIVVTTPTFGELKKSLAVHQITLPSPIFAKEPVAIRFQVVASGSKQGKCLTKLRIEKLDENSEWELVEGGEEEKSIPLLGSSNLGDFSALFAKQGRYKIEIEASSEGVKSASAVREIEVEPGRWKIALIAGRPGWDVGSIVRRAAFVPRYILQAAIGRTGTEWGYLERGVERDKENFSSTALITLEGVCNEADLFIFVELERRHLEQLPVGMIAERVADGASVFLVPNIAGIGGTPFFAEAGISEILSIDLSGATAFGGPRDVGLTGASVDHRATRSSSLQSVAREFPQVTCYFNGAKVASDADLLMEFEGGEPLLAVRTTENNRAAYLGTPDLWRWQFQPGEEGKAPFLAYTTLLDNLIRWLVAGDEEFGGNPIIVLSQTTAPIGKAIDIGVQYARTIEDPTATVRLSVTLPNETIVPVPLKREGGGSFSGQFSPNDPGEYTIRAEDPQRPSASDEAKIRVEPFSIETAVSGAQVEFLQRMAQETGGAWVDVEDIADLSGLEKLEPIFEMRVSTRILTEPLMSAPWIFLLLVILFSLEWLLRRTKDLP